LNSSEELEDEDEDEEEVVRRAADLFAAFLLPLLLLLGVTVILGGGIPLFFCFLEDGKDVMLPPPIVIELDEDVLLEPRLRVDAGLRD
jgi:hypothetical protein